MSVNIIHTDVPAWTNVPVQTWTNAPVPVPADVRGDPVPGVDWRVPVGTGGTLRAVPGAGTPVAPAADARTVSGADSPLAPALDPRTVQRLHVAALEAQVATLEAELSAARTRHQRTIDRYEEILARRTEVYRSWLVTGESPPGEFEWIGQRDDCRTATDGGRARTAGPLGRVLTWIRNLFG